MSVNRHIIRRLYVLGIRCWGIVSDSDKQAILGLASHHRNIASGLWIVLIVSILVWLIAGSASFGGNNLSSDNMEAVCISIAAVALLFTYLSNRLVRDAHR